MDVPPLRPRHHPPVDGEIKRTDADVPADVRRRRMQTAAFADELAGLRPVAPSLVATAAGSMAKVLLTIPAYAVRGGPANPYGAVYRDLLAKLPAVTELVILTHEAVADDVRGWLRAAGRSRAPRRSSRPTTSSASPCGPRTPTSSSRMRPRAAAASPSSSRRRSRATATRSSPTRSARRPA